MPMELDYSDSYEDNNLILPMLEGFLEYWDTHIQRVKAEIRSHIAVEDIDVEYINLCLDEIELEIANLLVKKIESVKSLSDEKLRDLKDYNE